MAIRSTAGAGGCGTVSFAVSTGELGATKPGAEGGVAGICPPPGVCVERVIAIRASPSGAGAGSFWLVR